jgi:hypothetical protein
MGSRGPVLLLKNVPKEGFVFESPAISKKPNRLNELSTEHNKLTKYVLKHLI